MAATRRTAIGLGDIGPGKGRVARHFQPGAPKRRFDPVDDVAVGRSAETVPQNHLRTPPAAPRDGIHRLMRHRVAIHQDRLAELRMGLVELRPERRMIGLPIGFDPPLGFAARQLAQIDRLPIGHHPGDHTQPRSHARVVPAGPHPVDQRRVQFIRPPVEIDKRPRSTGADERRAHLGGRCKQLIDKGILGTADGHFIQSRALDEPFRIVPSAMRRSENNARAALLRKNQVIRGLGHQTSLPSRQHRPEYSPIESP